MVLKIQKKIGKLNNKFPDTLASSFPVDKEILDKAKAKVRELTGREELKSQNKAAILSIIASAGNKIIQFVAEQDIRNLPDKPQYQSFKENLA